MMILLYGPDTFRSYQKLQEIIDQYQKSHKQGLNLSRFGSDDIDFQDFQNTAKQVSMFKEKKLIVLIDAFSNADFKEKFLEQKEKFFNTEDIIIFLEKQKILAKDSVLKLFAKKGKVQNFDSLQGDKLLAWIESRIKKYGSDISVKAKINLALYVGNDLWRMDQEIKKLVSYKHVSSSAYKNKKIIDDKDVVLLVKPKIETDIFRTIDAIAEKRKNSALRLLHNHLTLGESPLYLLTMINYQFRNLLVIKDLIEKNYPFNAIIQKSGLHPFVVKKSWAVAQKFSFLELKKIYRKIFQIDSDIKTGKVDAGTALDLFIAEI